MIASIYKDDQTANKSNAGPRDRLRSSPPEIEIPALVLRAQPRPPRCALRPRQDRNGDLSLAPNLSLQAAYKGALHRPLQLRLRWFPCPARSLAAVWDSRFGQNAVSSDPSTKRKETWQQPCRRSQDARCPETTKPSLLKKT